MVLETLNIRTQYLFGFFTLEYELALNHHNCYEDNKNKKN